jgi:hypothetical protein
MELSVDFTSSQGRLGRVNEEDGKDEDDLGVEVNELDLNSSKIRLTGER